MENLQDPKEQDLPEPATFIRRRRPRDAISLGLPTCDEIGLTANLDEYVSLGNHFGWNGEEATDVEEREELVGEVG